MPDLPQGKVVLANVSVPVPQASEHVERGAGNAVVVEAWPQGAGSADLTTLDSADPTVGYNPALDPAGTVVGMTAYTKKQVTGVLPFVTARLQNVTGSWTVRVTPIEAVGSTSVNATVSGTLGQGAPNAGGVNAWPTQAADGAIGTLGVSSGAAVTTDAAGTVQQYLRGLVAYLAQVASIAFGWLRVLQQPATFTATGTSGANAAQTVTQAAAGAGVRNLLGTLEVSWSGGAVAAGTKVEIKDGATVLWTGYLGDGTSVLGRAFWTFAAGQLRTTANTALNVVVDAAGAGVTTKCSLAGTTGP